MKLSYGQLLAVLFLFRAFALICSGMAYSINQMIGVAVSAVVQFALIIPLIIIIKAKTFEYDKAKKKGLVFSVYFILFGAMSFKRLLDIMGAGNFSNVKNIASVILLAIVCFYCAGFGIHALGRTAVAVQGLFIFFLAILFIGVYIGIDFSNFKSVSESDSITQYAIQDFASSGEIIAMFVLPAFTADRCGKAIYFYFGLRLIITEIVSLVGITVLGGVAELVQYPFFGMCSFSQPFSVQRSDALFVISYALICIVNITADIIISAKFAECITKKGRLFSVLLIIAAGLIMGNMESYITECIVISIFVVLSYIIVPSMIVKKEKRKGPVTDNV